MVRGSGTLLKCAGVGINTTLLEILVCPLSKQPLKLCEQTNSLISDSIGVSYPIVDGIPRLVPADANLLDAHLNSSHKDSEDRKNSEASMGEGDLWDDSLLIRAFDDAISKYKIMHKMSGSNVGEKANINTEESLPAAEADNESNKFRPSDENLQNADNLHTELETTVKIGETAELSQIKANSLSEKCVVGSSDIQNGNIPPTNENSAAKSGSPAEYLISSDLQSQNEAAWHSNAQEEYSQLLNKYYEIEGQRQQVLQQLNQYNNWNYEHPIPSTSTSQEYQTSDTKPYDTFACYCPYGCQNWVVPNNSLPDSCSGGACVGNRCNDVPRESQPGNPMPREDPEFVKTAMLAAKRALSSLPKETNGVKDNQLGAEIGHFAESTKSPDLDVVLNAWYSAGFYTGKYLSEQSMEKTKHGQGP